MIIKTTITGKIIFFIVTIDYIITHLYNFCKVVGILLSAVSAMILGFLWYGPLFGKPWMKLSGFTQKDFDKGSKKGMNTTYAISMLTSVVMAFVLQKFINMFGVTTYSSSLELGFWIWLGFVATTMITAVLYDSKPWKLFLINTGYQLASLLVMALILVTF